jgi:hypothetical protein
MPYQFLFDGVPNELGASSRPLEGVNAFWLALIKPNEGWLHVHPRPASALLRNFFHVHPRKSDIAY